MVKGVTYGQLLQMDHNKQKTCCWKVMHLWNCVLDFCFIKQFIFMVHLSPSHWRLSNWSKGEKITFWSTETKGLNIEKDHASMDHFAALFCFYFIHWFVKTVPRCANFIAYKFKTMMKVKFLVVDFLRCSNGKNKIDLRQKYTDIDNNMEAQPET